MLAGVSEKRLFKVNYYENKWDVWKSLRTVSKVKTVSFKVRVLYVKSSLMIRSC